MRRVERLEQIMTQILYGQQQPFPRIWLNDHEIVTAYENASRIVDFVEQKARDEWNERCAIEAAPETERTPR